MSSFSRLDYWLLARCVAGYRQEQPNGKPSDLTQRLLYWLEEVTPGNREMLLKTRISPADMKEVLAVDTEASEPSDRLAAPDAVSPVAEHSSWYIIPASELKKLPPVTWLIPGELPENGLTMLYGASGSAKSFLALDYALHISQRHKVLYGAFEGEQGYSARIQAWCEYHRKKEDNLFMVMGYVEMMRDTEMSRFVTAAQQIQPRLIVVDTVAMSMLGGDENSARDVGLYIKACKTLIREIGCAVLLVHHTNKAGQAERGSGAMRGACDMMIRLTLQDDVIVKECSKSKDSKHFETTFHRLLSRELHMNGRLEQSAVIVTTDKVIQLPGEALTANQQKVLETLSLSVYADTGCSFADIESDTGIGRGSLGRITSRLIGLGFIRRDGKMAQFHVTESGKKKIGLDDSHDSHDSHDSSGQNGNGEKPPSQVSQPSHLPGFAPRKKSALDL